MMQPLQVRLAQLDPERRRLVELELLRRREGAAAASARRRSVGDAPPLSLQQEDVWYAERLDPCTPRYNIPCAFRLRGPLDVPAMRESIREIARRHESLGSAFPPDDRNLPSRVVPSATPVDLFVHDLSGLAPAERDPAVLRRIEEASLRPFDLERGPLTRWHLLRTTEAESVLVLCIHHIVGDGWSLGVLLGELSSLYAAFAGGGLSPLPEPDLQYGDFAAWQRSSMQEEAIERQLAYWQGRLRGVPPVLELPRRSPAQRSGRMRAESVGRALEASVAGRIAELARSGGCTVPTVLLSAFGALLARCSGTPDVLIGCPLAARDRGELENLVGLFVNTAPLRVECGGDPEFGTLLRRVRERMLEAQEQRFVPMGRLAAALGNRVDGENPPLFQVTFNHMKIPGERLRLPGITIDELPVPATEAKYDLTLYVRETPDRIGLRLHYNADLFEESRMVEMLSHFEHLLRAVVEEPSLRLSSIPLRRGGAGFPHPPRSHAERTRVGEFAASTIPGRFTERVRSAPRRGAVRDQARELTYAELDAWTNRIANAVLGAVPPGAERVGLAFSACTAGTIAALLGSLKAGKAYVPLDLTYPPQRLAYTLADSGPQLILTDEASEATVRRTLGSAVPLLLIDRLGDGASTEAPEVRVAPSDVAYVLYTSGSTGRPKGVVQTHANVLHFNRQYADFLGIDAADRVSLLASFAFDAAVGDIFGALLNGATLLPFDLRDRGLAECARWIDRERITVYHSTPTVFRYLDRALEPDRRFPSVRRVVLGGEQVLPRDVELFRRHFEPHCTLVNTFGPTEATVALLKEIHHASASAALATSIGLPADAMEVALVSEVGPQEAVYGVGEIVLKSRHVALGYWRDPERTNRAFLPDPDDPSRTMYRTGDLGRWLPEGEVEYLGRLDQQVKIRGVRAEPAEVEAALLWHPAVREAVVTAQETEAGERRLVGYVVVEGGRPTRRELRAQVRGWLPEAMVPSAFVFLDAMPLTPTRKIDRLALPTPDPAASEAEFRAPRSEVEEAVCRIWSQTLRVGRVGIDDDFFALGGHSLAAMEIIARLEAEFGVEVALRSLFMDSTAASLATEVERLRKEMAT